MSSWYKTSSIDNDVVLSTRIRLARNIVALPFPHKMKGEDFQKLNTLVKDAVLQSDTPFSKSLRYIAMDSVPKMEVYAMAERHIISPEFAQNCEGRAILINEDESVCVMIGEEDHIRIQVILGGLQLEKAYEIADDIDRIITSKLNIAFDEQLGFLTECPTNLGTGLRASVMFHLPMLESEGFISSAAETIGKIGFTVRGMYGEGSKAAASLYQISNQVTLGITEKNATYNLKLIANQIIERERSARQNAYKEKIEDLVWRAYGILRYARLISGEEMMKQASLIKLGVSMGIIDIDSLLPIRILIETKPYMLCRKIGERTPEERDKIRADAIREMLA